ncbi:uncharacterized protein BDW43DRAFT_28430 [Aspergillus alliaceus]|uniref:uncharacterized protein n=1 Tax=Petromyces alliaceus TaxID=209559 RepID=UPI0012A3B884|nr:uncharacterized protein BDW43DRAFT_28430 [Aspergillus alliaceus]KAB8226957.1 hypothetical protein BDW43DRAFT_28430 [Aspergillus alliaceus]
MVSFALIARVTFFSCPPLFLIYNFRSFLGPDPLNMVFLTVGVPVSVTMPLCFIRSFFVLETDRKHMTGLDTIAYFDLLHNIGEKLERIGRLNNIQRIDLLEQAEAGGSIGWHMLWTEEKIISSTCSASCEDMYWVMVSIVLVKDLRIDMKELGKLERFQVADLFRRLKALDYELIVQTSHNPPHLLPQTPPCRLAMPYHCPVSRTIPQLSVTTSKVY